MLIMDSTSEDIRRYMAEIGQRGGHRSRRTLTAEQARDMVRVREAKRLFRRYYAQCFWYMKPDMPITVDDIPAIIRGLKQSGGREGFLLAKKLCR